MLSLVEHFFSIQGEGKYTGVPSLFFRLGGCNMRCEGFGCVETSPTGEELVGCDTLYAVDKKAFGQSWNNIESADELIAIFKNYRLPSDVDIVFTGGEPLLHASNPILIAFLEYLVSQHHRVTFETNSAVAVDFDKFPVYKSAIYALSVKLSNSGEPYHKRVQPKIINSIIESADETFFKFTVDEASLNGGLDDEIDSILSLVHKTEITCMPKGGSKEEVEANTKAVIEYCKEKGFRYSDRLHIRIWDQNKGV
ncbi:MAG: 7-carboxy-7-deazaguanine synthase QueE [Campylobacterota bacterium]|nr:7-carboxy-7-deazaguanine synthase QueE [Campylobacterota bacterium]